MGKNLKLVRPMTPVDTARIWVPWNPSQGLMVVAGLRGTAGVELLSLRSWAGLQGDSLVLDAYGDWRMR